MPERVSVLAIGVDAAEPTFVRQLIDAGRLPALQRLARDGQWRRVQSPAHIGSGAVWPTFMTGAGPDRHGVYAEWAWRPAQMAVERYSGAALRPFWSAWAAAGHPVGMLDVPFAPVLGVSNGFEVKEWGPHDAFDGQHSAHPPSVAARLATVPVHPFYADGIDPAGPADVATLRALADACQRGAVMRGHLASQLLRDLRPAGAVIVFPEIHHASHYLWHGVAPDAPVYRGQRFPETGTARGALEDLLIAVDGQIDRLVRDAGDPPTVAVFSLHGMRAGTGIAALLGPALAAGGFARLSDWRSQSWRERAASAFAVVKRHSPAALKTLYYRSVPPATTRKLARTTMLPAYDWARTRAFALPSDQHGWVRLNLRGREARGTVNPSDYERTCGEVDAFVRSLRDADGRPLAHTILRTASRVDDALTSPLPDLVVHWDDAALATPLRLANPRLTVDAIGRKFTGQHAFEGFCLWKSDRALPDDAIVDATALSRLLTDAL